MDKFRSAGIITFVVGDDDSNFINYSHALATRIWISFVGPRSKVAGFTAAFKNHGRALIFDDSGVAHIFSHVTVPVSYEVGPNGEEVVSGEIAPPGGDYVGVSPFGPWTLAVLNLQPDVLKEIKDVTIHFDGFARSGPKIKSQQALIKRQLMSFDGAAVTK